MNITCQVNLASLAVSHTSCSFYLDGFFGMGGKWPYSCCFMGWCFQDLFKTACSILVWFLSSFFSICPLSVHVVHPYRDNNTAQLGKDPCFILSDRSDFHIIDNLLLAVYTDIPFSWWDIATKACDSHLKYRWCLLG